jgi:UDP-N-acetylglucosamine 2-epimerase (non-hydrolysing)
VRNALAEWHGTPGYRLHPSEDPLGVLGTKALDSRTRHMKRFGFHDYNRLEIQTFCAISDSGTIAEEASILGFPAITPSEVIECPEGFDIRCLNMRDVDRDTILSAVGAITRIFSQRKASGLSHPMPADYQITNTPERVVAFILGTAKLSNGRDCIRTNDLN